MTVEAHEPMTPTHGRITLLVVEDDADQRFLVERRLEDMDVEVRLATTGIEALASLEGVDLVLLDYRLPDMSGLEILRAIRASEGPSVVMVTGMGSASVAVEAMRAGAIDYVAKDASYLRSLPEIIERSWRHHDLTRRAGKLQKLALLVSEAEDRDTMLDEIVNGARELLAADVCALAVPRKPGGIEIAATSPGGIELTDPLVAQLEAVLISREIDSVDGLLLVPLSKRGDEALGVLVVGSKDERAYSTQEIELAQTFASFGALALRKLRRQELEQSLIQELQQTLELRQDFVNSVSHELRTPLACISGFSTTLLNYWGRLDEATTVSSIEKITHHAADLAKLVDALLDFGAMEHGHFTAVPEAVDLPAQISALIEDLQPLLQDRKMETDIEKMTVQADASLLKRVLINLLSNAVKASPVGSAIVVRARAVEGVARIEVLDNGEGLASEELEKAFEPFWRSRSSVKAAKRGAGIGLTLAREYVRAMGGEIGATSEPGRGSVFYFTLPLAQGSVGLSEK
jgi:signal transduction histidine kinase/FixJ family two-component response regulator